MMDSENKDSSFKLSMPLTPLMFFATLNAERTGSEEVSDQDHK
jgi:hypothetical protein